MNFDFTEHEEAFRKEVRHWLEANLPEDLRGRAFASSRAGLDEVRKLRAWQQTMHAAGYVGIDRKSTRLNSSHLVISYAVFCLKKKKKKRVNRKTEYVTHRAMFHTRLCRN